MQTEYVFYELFILKPIKSKIYISAIFLLDVWSWYLDKIKYLNESNGFNYFDVYSTIILWS